MTRFERKHRDILNAATRAFLRNGFLGTNMEEIAKEATVSKQTVYKHCVSKEALFLEIVADLTSRATELSYRDMADPTEATDVRAFLIDYAFRELDTLLVPEVMQLRRLVIGEADRFPELAESYYRGGPQVGIDTLAWILRSFADRGVLQIPEARQSAQAFNWLVLGHYLNTAMFLGDKSLPNRAEIREHAARSVDFFLRAHQ